MSSSFDQLSDWLSEVQSLSDEAIAKVVASSATDHGPANNPDYNFPENGDLVRELTGFIEESYDDESCFESICEQLLSLYFKGNFLRIFVIQFLPAFICTYLTAVARGKRCKCIYLETFLIAVYNCEICETPSLRPNTVLPDFDSGMQKKVHTVKIPTLAMPSIYHDPNALCSGSSLLPNNDVLLNRLSAPSVCSVAFSNNLDDLKCKGPPIVHIGPFPSFTHLNAENRLLVLTRLGRTLNDELAKLHLCVVKYLCRTVSTLCRNGFQFSESDMPQKIFGSPPDVSRRGSVFQPIVNYSFHPRCNVSAALLLELLNSVYFALFNDAALEGLEALDAVHQRAQFELYPDVILMTNAIINSLEENPSGTPREGPMGIRVTSSHWREGSKKESKNKYRKPRELVTNASLKIRRMPEDIPVKSPIEIVEDSPRLSDLKGFRKDMPVLAAAKKMITPHKPHLHSSKKDKDSHKKDSPDSGRPLLESARRLSSSTDPIITKKRQEVVSMTILPNGEQARIEIGDTTRPRFATETDVVDNANFKNVYTLSHSHSSPSDKMSKAKFFEVKHSVSNQINGNPEFSKEVSLIERKGSAQNEIFHTPEDSPRDGKFEIASESDVTNDDIRHVDSVDDLSDD